MAEARTIVKSVIDSDNFLSMPPEAQLLFFHLIMRAKTNGIIDNLRGICREVNIDRDFIIALQSEGYIKKLNEDLSEITNWDEVTGKGGLAKKRLTYRYRKWRGEILERDHYTCVVCGGSENLEAHHKKRFSEYEESRYDIKNGVTLCKSCHMRLHAEERKHYGTTQDDSTNDN